MKFLCKRNDNRGSSLVELIIVVAIMSIIAARFIPTYIRYIEKSKVQKWLSEADSFYGTFEVTLVEVKSEGYTPSKGEVVLLDSQVHELWGSGFGVTVEGILQGCFGDYLKAISNISIRFNEDGMSQYYYIEFVDGSTRYKFYNIIDPAYSNLIPADDVSENLSSNWYLVKERI